VIVPEVLPASELAAIDAEVDRLLARPDVGGKLQNHPGWLLQLGLHSDLMRRFVQDERVLDLVGDIVQPGIAIYSAKLATKLPHNPEVCHWHQDDAYYVKQSDSQTRMSVWIPLQDAHQRNGCLWVLPGSHHWGLQPHMRYDYGQCRTAMRYEDVDLSLAIPVEVPAGTAVLFSALLWHYSKGNETDHVRRAFIVSYQEATVPRGNGAQWKILRPAPAAS
jgi:ectoine hydroxylase-related dioxygenase (phytanoyl-CoA dioxygenase family)